MFSSVNLLATELRSPPVLYQSYLISLIEAPRAAVSDMSPHLLL